MTGERATPPAEPILHVDLDAFYASVEILKDPALSGKPVVVGNPSPRGVVLSASYEARARGLHSAMPSLRARRLCPDAVFVPPDFSAYQAYSNRFREILLSFTPVVEPLSLDEAFLDATGAMLLFGSPKEMGERIRAAVRSELNIGASVGIGPNKLIAKLASIRSKPDGLLLIPASKVLSFLHPLPVDALWGIGEKTGQTLRRLGIRTVGELAAMPRSILDRVLGESHGASLATLALGGDTRTVVPFEAPKSVSHEETYPRDLDHPDEILREILALSHRVAARLRADGYRARTVTLKLRLPSFSTLTRSRTIPTPTDLGADIFHIAGELFRRLPEGRRRFRLIGVSATGLVPAGAEQVALVNEGRWEEAERALDRIEKRFGKGAAVPATLLGRERPRSTAERQV
ncbi:MAG TPA: DNA polymerase IV [Actinomycetota bacterium]|nr:DNA polymerase IV [Actinomycetota bacterium]